MSFCFPARYRTPSITSDPEKIQPGRQRTLTCDTDGGHPKGELRWYDDVDTDWTTSAEFQATRREDGRFRLSSTLTLMPGSTFSKYTCVVLNASGAKEEEATFDIVTSLSPEEISGPGGIVHGLIQFTCSGYRNRRGHASPEFGNHSDVT